MKNFRKFVCPTVLIFQCVDLNFYLYGIGQANVFLITSKSCDSLCFFSLTNRGNQCNSIINWHFIKGYPKLDKNYLNFCFMEFFFINIELCHIFCKKQFVWSTKTVCHVTITSRDVLGAPNSKWRITKGKFVVCFICLHFVKMVCYCYNFKYTLGHKLGTTSFSL